jgi:Domain of unknown function (DUF4136)
MKMVKLAAIVLALLFCPLAQAQHVKVNWNTKTNFSKYKTYSWKDAKNPGNPIFAQWVQPDVDTKLAVAGVQFLYPGQSPDLYVIYSVHTVEKEDATTTMEGYGWANGPWSSYSGLNDQEAEGLPPVETVTTDTPTSLGILTIDIVDRVKKVVVWRSQGSIEHISKDDRKNSEQVQRLVNRMFQKFPPT